MNDWVGLGQRPYIVGSWRWIHLSAFQDGAGANALTSHSARLSLSAAIGVVGVCSFLAAFRGVSEGWGTLVVIYSVSNVECELDEGFEQ